MSIVSNSSTVSTRKPRLGKTVTDLKRNRMVTTIKPSKQASPTSWRSRPLPLWFLWLNSWQRRFGIATYMLIGGMLMTYSSTVYLQQQWNQEFHKLENLQLHERQLTTTNEAIKNQLAKEAEQKSTNLIPPNPAAAIILQPSSPPNENSLLKTKVPSQPKIDIPAGY